MTLRDYSQYHISLEVRGKVRMQNYTKSWPAKAPQRIVSSVSSPKAVRKPMVHQQQWRGMLRCVVVDCENYDKIVWKINCQIRRTAGRARATQPETLWENRRCDFPNAQASKCYGTTGFTPLASIQSAGYKEQWLRNGYHRQFSVIENNCCRIHNSVKDEKYTFFAISIKE